MKPSPHLTPHLTEEQLDLLLQPAAKRPPVQPPSQTDTVGDARAHLASCLTCQTELTSLRSTFNHLRAASTAMAQSKTLSPITLRASGLAQPDPPASARRSSLLMAYAAVGLIAASLALLRPSALLRAHPRPSGFVSPSSATPTQSSQSDEAFLDDLHRDLATAVPPSLTPLDLSPAKAGQPRSSNR